MAMIKCPECRKRVSDTAFTCPRCGFAVSNWTSARHDARIGGSSKIKRVFGIFALALVAFVMIGGALNDADPSIPKQVTKEPGNSSETGRPSILASITSEVEGNKPLPVTQSSKTQ